MWVDKALGWFPLGSRRHYNDYIHTFDCLDRAFRVTDNVEIYNYTPPLIPSREHLSDTIVTHRSFRFTLYGNLVLCWCIDFELGSSS